MGCRALKDTNIRGAGPGYHNLFFLALQDSAGNVHVGDDDEVQDKEEVDTNNKSMDNDNVSFCRTLRQRIVLIVLEEVILKE